MSGRVRVLREGDEDGTADALHLRFGKRQLPDSDAAIGQFDFHLAHDLQAEPASEREGYLRERRARVNEAAEGVRRGRAGEVQVCVHCAHGHILNPGAAHVAEGGGLLPRLVWCYR